MNKSNSATSTFSMEENIWDEIIKSITEKMPLQLLPLIEEVFHKHYPPGTTVKLLSTDHIVPTKDSTHHMSRISTDITILIQNDIYHIECQMNHDKEMVVRMIEYDFHIALQHGIMQDKSGIYTLQFPSSVVMYPGTNSQIPDKLLCNVLFPDGSTHQYSVPTVKVQTYSLEEIRTKHLTLFIPFMLLSFRPRLSSKQNPITLKELTDYVGELILILEAELHNGNLTVTQFLDYIKLINYSAVRVFHAHEQYQQEVYNMTKSILSLPSDKIDELEDAIAEKDAAIAEKDATIADQGATIESLKLQLLNAGIKPCTL
ncbi:MAG: hypothetical protein ACI4FV_03145 [Lachnospiraceae bacterium]